MIDMSMTIVPRSDQLNSDDLIGGPRTIKITRVSASPDSAEQPVSVYFEGDGGKPYKPCKSMRRVMVQAWGADASRYVGRGLTLYRDDKVAFGGMQVGGIRISHMSDLSGPMTFALTVTKAKRAPYSVKPLAGWADAPKTPRPSSDAQATGIAALAAKAAQGGTEAFREWLKTDTARAAYADGTLTAAILADCRTIASGADNMRAMPDPLADADLPPVPPDPEIEAQIARELAERDRALEGGAS